MFYVLVDFFTETEAGVFDFRAGQVSNLDGLTTAMKQNVLDNGWVRLVDGAPGLEPVVLPVEAPPAPESHPHAVGWPPAPGTWEYIEMEAAAAQQQAAPHEEGEG